MSPARLLAAGVVALVSAGCAVAWSREAPCRRLGEPRPLPGAVGETSGVAISVAHPGIYWTHNDSGGEPLLYAVDSEGALRGRVRVSGADARDWEDLALSRCGAGHCLYIGDFGDNDEVRDEVVVYRVPEPDPGDDATAPADRFPLRYPAGARDAEALFVLPGESIHVVSKGRSDPVAVYRRPGPPEPGPAATLERVRVLTADAPALPRQITGAGASPDGRWVVLRTYASLQLYAVEDGRFDAVYPPPGADLRSLREAQGEAVALGDDGMVVLTSESGFGPGPPGIARLRCRLP